MKSINVIYRPKLSLNELQAMAIGALSIKAKAPTIKQYKKNWSYISVSNGIFLTPREYQIATMLLQSKFTYKKIANEIGISWRTVEYHATRLRSKLNAASRKELVSTLQQLLSSVKETSSWQE